MNQTSKSEILILNRKLILLIMYYVHYIKCCKILLTQWRDFANAIIILTRVQTSLKIYEKQHVTRFYFQDIAV